MHEKDNRLLNKIAEFADANAELEYEAAEIASFRRPISKIYPAFGGIFLLLSFSDYLAVSDIWRFLPCLFVRFSVLAYAVVFSVVLYKVKSVRLRMFLFGMGLPYVNACYITLIFFLKSSNIQSHSFSMLLIMMGGILLGGRWVIQLVTGIALVVSFMTLSVLIFNRDLSVYTFVETGVMLSVALVMCLVSSYLINVSRRNQYYRERQLERMSRTDTLTALGNRQSFDEKLAYLCEQKDSVFSLVFFDLDDFKVVNDTHGHQTGDDVLRDTAALISQHIRSGDIFARWGGEEFAIIFTGLPGWQTLELSKRLCVKMAAHEFSFGGYVTASFGVTGHISGDTSQDVVRRADEALYTAKNSGKNCAVLA